MRVGADLLVRLLHQRRELGLWNSIVLDAHLDREAEPAALARADRHGARYFGGGRVALLLLRDEVDRPAEAGGVTRGEKMFRRGRSRLTRTAHLLRYGEVGLDETVARLSAPVAPANGGRVCGKKRLYLIHGVSFR